MSTETFAIIDLGSNSVRMSIYRVNENGGCVFVKRARETVRLSQDMEADMLLKDSAINDTLAVLKGFCSIAAEQLCRNIFAITTQAVRSAKNQDEFLDRVTSETDLIFRVLTGYEEAYYAYLAVINTVSIRDFVILDTGGGSSEIAFIQDGKLTHTTSLPIGAVVMTDRFIGKDYIYAQGIFDLTSHINRYLADIDWLSEARGLPLIVIGGSNKCLAQMDRNSTQNFDGEHLIRCRVAEQIYRQLLPLSLESRKKVLGMDKNRADTIVAGLTPTILLSALLLSQHIIYVNKGVCDGVFYEIRKIIQKTNKKM